MISADLDEVLLIEQDVHAHPWTRGNFSDALLSDNLCYVHENEESIVGYAVLLPVVDEIELLNICIATKYQRKGLGRKLLDELMKIAVGMKMRRMLLEVRVSNIPALGLYNDAGFRKIGLRRDYYVADNGREDAIVMECLMDTQL